jgi:transcriptional regulator with XRE-family HTH domain
MKLVQEYRLKKNMTQAELAQKAHLSQSTITQIERGKKAPSMETIGKIAQALEVSPAVFFSDEDKTQVVDFKKWQKYKTAAEMPPEDYKTLAELVRLARKLGMV